MGGYTSNCEKKSKSLHPNAQNIYFHRMTYENLLVLVILIFYVFYDFCDIRHSNILTDCLGLINVIVYLGFQLTVSPFPLLLA